jgi:hypothetical protein
MRTVVVRGAVWCVLMLVVAAVGPSVALGSGSYRLKKGGKCRSGYVRQVRKRGVWCRVLTDTRLDTNAGVPSGYTTYWTLSGGIYYGPRADRGAGTELKGRRITYTVKDDTTGKVLGSFVGTSNFEATCTIASTLDSSGTAETLMGQADPPYAGCALSPVTLPAADEAGITGRFAGTSTYAPSVSFEAAV